MGGPNLLPEWLRWLWVVVYGAILIVHLRHAVGKGGQRRAWHSGHTLMAVGMAYMFLPPSLKVVPGLAWQVMFAAAAGAIGAWTLQSWSSHRAVNLLWALSLISMLAMVYMFALPGGEIPPLTYLLIAYFATETVFWLIGSFDELEPSGRRYRMLPFAIGPRFPEARSFAEPLFGAATSVEMRISLGLMAAGMAYMFFAMHFGNSAGM